MKKEIKIVENWSRWCECHNGALPILDLNGYQCQKCKQIVCVNCIYDTEKGFICADCIKKVKPKKIISINPPTNKSTKTFIQALVLAEIMLFVLTIITIIFNIQGAVVSLILAAIVLAIIIIGIILFKEKNKPNKQKLSEKELKKLDKKIKKQNKS